MGKLHVLHVLGRLDRGGAETMVMNLYRYIDRGRVSFDFVIHTQDICDYTEEVLRMGGHIYSMEPFCASTALRYRRQWRRFFKKHREYDIVHGHMRSTASLYLKEAKRAGMVTIAHSHNTSSGSGLSALVKTILQYPLRYQADYLFACSKPAGIWLFGKAACQKPRFYILKNGIEPEAFRFERQIRQRVRRELLAEESGAGQRQDALRVFLHVGRLEEQKNHRFLLHVMKEIVKREPDTRLWLCGVGRLEEELRSLAKELEIASQVRFLGMRADVPALMQAADAVIFPSLFEGIPLTLIEAQAAGLPVLMADTITEEVALTDLVRALPLSATPEEWAQEALAMLGEGPGAGNGAEIEARRGAYAKLVGDSGYDVAKNAGALTEFYARAAFLQKMGRHERRFGRSR